MENTKDTSCKHCGEMFNTSTLSNGTILSAEKKMKYGSYIVCEPCYKRYNAARYELTEKIKEADRYFDVDFFELAARNSVENLNYKPAF